MSVLSIILLCLIPGLIGFPIFYFYHGNQKLEKDKPPWLFSLLYISRALLFSCTWPIIGIIYLLAGIAERNAERNADRNRAVEDMKSYLSGERIDDGKLKFTKLYGKGEILCKECGYHEEVVVSLHGFGEDRWTNTGYQCQRCGKFSALERDHKLDKIPNCNCGGNLSKEDELFCPACLSNNIEYHMRIMT